MSFYDVYPPAAPVPQPPRGVSAINRLGNAVEHFLDQCMIREENGVVVVDHGKESFPAAGATREEIDEFVEMLMGEGHIIMVDVHVVPWYLRWWESGPVSRITIHF